jgi:hypothetical protein
MNYGWVSKYTINSNVTLSKSTVCLSLLLANLPVAAQALTIHPIYDSSITALSNAATVEAAFMAAAAAYSSVMLNPVTVNINVSWGSVGGQVLGGGSIGGSNTSIGGLYTYSQMKTYLLAGATSAVNRAAIAGLPSVPVGPRYVSMSTAQGKALGLIAATATAIDGAIGFGSSPRYTFNPSSGVAAGTYDFVSVAAHEIGEVLGRTSTLTGSASFYQTSFDLFRYTAPRVQSYSYSDAAYFSLDGGITSLGSFNNTGSGDGGDWLTGPYPGDVQNAYATAGIAGVLSAADIAALSVLGWGSTLDGIVVQGGVSSPGSIHGVQNVPEPAGLLPLGCGIMASIALGRGVRRDRA